MDSPELRVAATYEEFGQRLHLLAHVLTHDSDLAEQLVIQAIVAYDPEPSTLQELSEGVYVAWIGWGNPTVAQESAPTSGHMANERLFDQIHRLPDDQRAALGLCKYGGHTYRGAAEVLSLAPERVAGLLGDALRALGPAPVPAA
ncbi:MAG: hypothetical protein ABIN55_02815 [Aeromicrobium sp.]